MTAQQAIPVAITAAEMTTAERDFRAVIKLIIASAMIGTERPRGEIFVPAVIAKARRQLPWILPIDPNDQGAIGAAGTRHPACARGLHRKQKQAERRRHVAH